MTNGIKMTLFGTSQLAQLTANMLLAEVENDMTLVLCDPDKPEVATGLAFDLSTTCAIFGNDTRVLGTGDVNFTVNSDILIMAGENPISVTKSRRIKGFLERLCRHAKILSSLSPNALWMNTTRPIHELTFLLKLAATVNTKKILGINCTEPVLFLEQADLRACAAKMSGPEMSLVKKMGLYHQQIGAKNDGPLKGSVMNAMAASASLVTMAVKSAIQDEEKIIPCIVEIPKQPNGIKPFRTGQYTYAPFIEIPARISALGFDPILQIPVDAATSAPFVSYANKMSQHIERFYRNLAFDILPSEE